MLSSLRAQRPCFRRAQRRCFSAVLSPTADTVRPSVWSISTTVCCQRYLLPTDLPSVCHTLDAPTPRHSTRERASNRLRRRNSIPRTRWPDIPERSRLKSNKSILPYDTRSFICSLDVCATLLLSAGPPCCTKSDMAPTGNF